MNLRYDKKQAQARTVKSGEVAHSIPALCLGKVSPLKAPTLPKDLLGKK